MARERETSVVDKVNPVPKLVRIRVETAGPKPLWIRARVNEIQTREQDAGRAWDARLRWRQGSMCVIFRTDPRHVHGMTVFRRRDGKCLEWMHVDSSAHSGMRTGLHGGSAAGRVGECAPRDVARRRENHAPAGTHVLAADDTNTDGKRVMGVSMIGTETNTIPGGIVSEEPTRMRLRSHDRTEAHSRAKAPISVHIGRDPSSRLTISPRMQRRDGNRSKERWMRRSSVNRQPHPAAVPVLRTVCKLLERQSTSAAHEDLVQFLSTLRVQLEKHSQERASSEPFDVERLKHELLVTRLALLELMKPANSNATSGTARCPPPMREHNDESAPRARHSPALVTAVFSYVRCLEMHAASSGMDRPVESTAQALGLVAQDTTRLIHEMQIRAAGENPLGGSAPVSKLLPVNSSMSQLGQLIFSQTQLLASMRKERQGATEPWNMLSNELGRCAVQALVDAQSQGIHVAHYRQALRDLVQWFAPSDAPVVYATAIMAILEQVLSHEAVDGNRSCRQVLIRALAVGPELMALASGLENFRQNQRCMPETPPQSADIDASLHIRWHQGTLRLYEISARTIATRLFDCYMRIWAKGANSSEVPSVYQERQC